MLELTLAAVIALLILATRRYQAWRAVRVDGRVVRRLGRERGVSMRYMRPGLSRTRALVAAVSPSRIGRGFQRAMDRAAAETIASALGSRGPIGGIGIVGMVHRAMKNRGHATVHVGTDGTTVYAINGRTGEIIAEGTLGVDDQTVVDAAIAALPTGLAGTIYGHNEVGEGLEGGLLQFSEGRFLCYVDVSGLSNITIAGCGAATLIQNPDEGGTHGISSNNLAASPANRVVVRDLTVQGNALSGSGVYLHNCHYQHVFNVYAIRNGDHGIYIGADTENVSAGAENKIVAHCQTLFNGLDGIHLEGDIHETLVDSCHSEENDQYGLGANGCTNIHLQNCSIEDNYGAYGVYIADDRFFQMSNCVVEGAMFLGVNSASQYPILIDNCDIEEFYYDGTQSSLNISNCNIVIRTLKAYYLGVFGGYVSFGHAGDGVTEGYSEIGYSSVGGSLNIDTGFLTATNHRFKAVSDNVQFTIKGMSRSLALTIDGNAKNLTRCVIDGMNARTPAVTIDGISVVSVVGGAWVGGGSLTVQGAGTSTHIVGAILANTLALTIEASRTGTVQCLWNRVDGTSSITDNTGAATIIAAADVELVANKGAASGYASLDANSLIVAAQLARTWTSKSATATLTAIERTVAATGGAGGITLTLPSAATLGNGAEYVIKKVDADAGAVTVDADGTETIDGAATYSVVAQWESVTLRSDGTNWLVI